MPDMTDIRFDYRGALAETVGPKNGLTKAEWAELAEQAEHAVNRINDHRGETPYRDAPHDPAISKINEVKTLVDACRQSMDIQDVVLLGIGGSALTARALMTALASPFWNALSAEARRGRPRLWVIDNIDPAEVEATWGQIRDRLDHTLFLVISKSGATPEPLAQALAISAWAGAAWKDHTLVVTQPGPRPLRNLAGAWGIPPERILDAHPQVGGRFSGLTAVGLLPAALIGCPIDRILEGARTMDRRCTPADLQTNPAAQAAAVQVGLYRKGKRISVMMPYAAALRDVADWFRQLWAESLGKVDDRGEFVGPTPIKALGVTDQHSQVQLYREGPADKVFTVLSVEAFDGHTAAVPETPDGLDPDTKGAIAYLTGHSLADLLDAERRATVWAMAGLSGRPTVEIALPTVSPHTVGQLLYMLMVQTSIAGEMLGVNPYNQPGVEAGKEATRALMGMEGTINDPTAKGLPAEVTTYKALRKLTETFYLPPTGQDNASA